jgi:hypothetical protein
MRKSILLFLAAAAITFAVHTGATGPRPADSLLDATLGVTCSCGFCLTRGILVADECICDGAEPIMPATPAQLTCEPNGNNHISCGAWPEVACGHQYDVSRNGAYYATVLFSAFADGAAVGGVTYSYAARACNTAGSSGMLCSPYGLASAPVVALGGDERKAVLGIWQ